LALVMEHVGCCSKQSPFFGVVVEMVRMEH
jgi:hypothetical protein